MVDTIINERYILHHELGSGGMGVVYLAQDTLADTKVAVKALKTEIAHAEMIERFKREGEALRDLNHPNIVKMLDAFEHDGQHYLVMEYVLGDDLSYRLRRGKIPLEDILNLSIDLADALTRAHRLDIIHRDLKPANVLIGDDGVLRLTDFGVAHVGSKERVTETDAIIGTVDYLPPEAFDGTTFDQYGDIWAFGVILFEMLAGERPFKGDSLFEVIQAISTQPIPDLEVINPDCPIALVDLVYRMLERDPRARMSSVRRVGTELEDILQGRDKVVATKRLDDTPLPDYSTLARHNLPAQSTPFVGREHELAELENLLKDSDIRLITILAQGGMGKTRLCLELAQRAVDQNLYADGVYFVELAPLSDADNIPNAIADAAGYQFLDDDTLKEQLLMILRERHLLLVLDNYEHLSEGFTIVGDILKSAPNVHIIATSRQRLAQDGETLFHLSGMDFPKWETPDDALEYAAVKLLMNSAKRVRPDFELTGDNLDVVARICILVEGMPLGIVLAASWLAVLSLSEIANEIQGSLDFLETDETDLPERQRSIRAVMGYSWEQMTEVEQQVFMKLSVFRGGFTREAGQSIAGANLRILISLVNKSFIRRDADNGRYEIHELLRQYAEEQLTESDLYDSTRKLYSTYYLEWVQQHAKRFAGHGQSKALMAIHDELDNVRVAWLIAVANRDEALLAKATELGFVLFNLSRSKEGLELFDSALAIASIDNNVLRGKLLANMCPFAFHLRQFDQMESYARTSIDLLQDTQENSARLLAQFNIGHTYYFRNNIADAKKEYQAVVEAAHLHHIGFYEAMSLLQLASIAWLNGDLVQSETLYKDSLIINQDIGNVWGQAYVYENLAHFYMSQAKFKEAKSNAQNGLKASRIVNLYHIEVFTLLQLINLAFIDENVNDASDYFSQLHYRLSNIYNKDVENQITALESMLLILEHQLNLAKQNIHSYLVHTDYILKPYHLLPCIAFFIEQKNYLRASHIFGFCNTLEDDSAHNYYLDTLVPYLRQKLLNVLDDNAFVEAVEHGKSFDLKTVIRELIDEFGKGN